MADDSLDQEKTQGNDNGRHNSLYQEKTQGNDNDRQDSRSGEDAR